MSEKGKNILLPMPDPPGVPPWPRLCSVQGLCGANRQKGFLGGGKHSKGERKGKETLLSPETQKQQQFGSVPRVEILFFSTLHHHGTLEIKTTRVLANTLVNPQICRSPGFFKFFFSVCWCGWNSAFKDVLASWDIPEDLFPPLFCWQPWGKNHNE